MAVGTVFATSGSFFWRSPTSLQVRSWDDLHARVREDPAVDRSAKVATSAAG